MKANRYKVGLPPFELKYHHPFSVYCSPDYDFARMSWGRFGSGGKYDARHTFVDDWRLEHLWRRFGEGLAKAILAHVITAPDYTIETSFPFELVQYQVWRSRVLMSYWQEYGVVVIPVLQWGNPLSYELCSSGIRQGSVVAVRGPQRGCEYAWLDGAFFMKNALHPSLVLHFGNRLEIWDNGLYFPLSRR